MRLIDADKPIFLHEDSAEKNAICQFLRRQKTVEAVCVKHGHWHHVVEHAHMGGEEATEWDNFYCSECDAPSSSPYDYCPYCGSKNL